jgi:hypothetical protein
VHGVSVLDNPRRYQRNMHDDFHVVKALHKVLSKADVIVAHNGDAYDIKFFQDVHWRTACRGCRPSSRSTR